MHPGSGDDDRALAAYQIGDHQADAVVASTMLLTALAFFHLFGALLSRDQIGTIFDRDAIPAASQLKLYGISLIAIVAVTGLDLLERIVGTTGLTFDQWCICVGIAASIIVVEELIKLVLRRQHAHA